MLLLDPSVAHNDSFGRLAKPERGGTIMDAVVIQRAGAPTRAVFTIAECRSVDSRAVIVPEALTFA
jgi:hypothetical protein